MDRHRGRTGLISPWLPAPGSHVLGFRDVRARDPNRASRQACHYDVTVVAKAAYPVW